MDKLVEYFFTVGIDPAVALEPDPSEEEYEYHPFKRPYKAKVLSRYPSENRVNHKFPDENQLPHFCFPEGYLLKQLSPMQQSILPTYHGFVLTEISGVRMYGICIVIYEKLPEEILENLKREHQKQVEPGEKEKKAGEMLKDKISAIRQNIRSMETKMRGTGSYSELQRYDAAIKREKQELKQHEDMLQRYYSTFHMDEPQYYGKSFGFLSTYPFFDFFKDYLSILWRTILHNPSLPLERYIVNIVNEVPLPPPGKKEVKVTIENYQLYCRRPNVNDLPILKNFQFYYILRYFSAEEFVTVMECILNQRKIIFFSKSPCILNYAAATFTTLLYPFYWSFPYIPVLPKKLLKAVELPTVYMFGILDSYRNSCPKLDPSIVQVDLEARTIKCNQAPIRLPKSVRTELIEGIEELTKNREMPFCSHMTNILNSFGQLDTVSHLSMIESNTNIDKNSNRRKSVSKFTGEKMQTLDRDTVIQKFYGEKSTVFDDRIIQGLFLTAFVRLIKNYSSFLNPLTPEQIQDLEMSEAFDFDGFFQKISTENKEYKDFMKIFINSQFFSDFCAERAIRTKDDPEVLLVDGLIENPKNNAFFYDHSYEISEVVEAVHPISEGYGEQGSKNTSYSRFPDFLDPKELLAPREYRKLNDANLELKLRSRTQAIARIQRLMKHQKANGLFVSSNKRNTNQVKFDQELHEIYHTLLSAEIPDSELRQKPKEVLQAHLEMINKNREKLKKIIDIEDNENINLIHAQAKTLLHQADSLMILILPILAQELENVSDPPLSNTPLRALVVTSPRTQSNSLTPPSVTFFTSNTSSKLTTTSFREAIRTP